GLDLYKQYFNNNASEKQVVRAGKTFGIFLAIFSMALAPLLYGVEGGIFNYLQELNGSFSVPILAIILVGYFSKRVSGKAANIAIVFAVVTYLVTLYVVKPIIAGNAVAAAELAGGTDASELAMVAKDAFPSFLHIMGIIFVLVLIILFTVSKFFPRQTDYLEEYTRQVDITPWKYLKPAGVVICIAVVSIYVYFS
ncbi:MAG: solute:sodium symporter family transporter, partial [Leeuwenhoekiella sp.]|nr:solute:sodium symporter family transporter [Leeuwenhoekiella sp.]